MAHEGARERYLQNMKRLSRGGRNTLNKTSTRNFNEGLPPPRSVLEAQANGAAPPPPQPAPPASPRSSGVASPRSSQRKREQAAMRSGRQTVKAAPGRASTRPGPKLKKQQTKAMFQAAASAASKGLRTARAIKNAEGFIHEAHGLGHVDEDAIFEEDEDEEPSPGRRSGRAAHHAPRPPGLGMQGKSLTASSRQFGAAQRSHDAVRATMQMLSKSFKPESLQQSSARDATKEKEQTVIEEKDEDAEQATCAQVKEGKPNLFEALGHISKKRTVKDVDAIKETIHEFDDQLPMLATMSAVQLNAFFRAVTFVEATEGDTIVVKDQRVAALHLIYHGLVKTAGGADGAEERKLAKGAVFGESALVAPDDGDLAKGADAAKERWPENYVAASDCIVLVVKRTDLYPDKKKEPKRAYPSSYSGSVVDRIVQILEYGEPRQRPPEVNKDLAGLLNTFDFFKQLPRDAASATTFERFWVVSGGGDGGGGRGRGRDDDEAGAHRGTGAGRRRKNRRKNRHHR